MLKKMLTPGMIIVAALAFGLVFMAMPQATAGGRSHGSGNGKSGSHGNSGTHGKAGHGHGHGKSGNHGESSRVTQGYAISPVPLPGHPENRDLVGLGSYLVNAVGSCNDCHTCPSYKPGHNPYDGVGDGATNADAYLAGGVPFGPVLRSANLTPDATGKPAGLTLDEFIQAIRTGHDPDHPDEVLQVMVWPVLRNMTDHDLEAIYSYLSAIPPLTTGGTCTGPGE